MHARWIGPVYCGIIDGLHVLCTSNISDNLVPAFGGDFTALCIGSPMARGWPAVHWIGSAALCAAFTSGCHDPGIQMVSGDCSWARCRRVTPRVVHAVRMKLITCFLGLLPSLKHSP